MSVLSKGYIEGRRGGWHNRIVGPGGGVLLSDAKNIKVIHVGCHRSGSAFLQTKVFPKYAICKHIFSDDTICGRLFDNGLDHISEIKRLHPNASILIVIRNQESIINAAYRTYMKAGGTWSFPNYAKRIIAERKYDYYKLVKGYIDLFGRNKCSVHFFENLTNIPETFVYNVIKFVGAKNLVSHDYSLVKPSPSSLTNWGYSKINFLARLLMAVGVDKVWQRIFGHSSTPLSQQIRMQYQLWSATMDAKLIFPLFPGKLKLQVGYRRTLPLIQKAYGDGNAKLATLLNVNLEKLGYPISNS